jgi:hypothetical protein
MLREEIRNSLKLKAATRLKIKLYFLLNDAFSDRITTESVELLSKFFS